MESQEVVRRFEALTHGGIRASSHPPVSVAHQSGKSMESASNCVKYVYNFFNTGTHSPMPPWRLRGRGEKGFGNSYTFG